MESRRSESAPASVATEIMQPAVIKVTPSLLADLNPLVTTAPLARISKADEGHDQHQGMVAAECDHFCQPGGLV